MIYEDETASEPFAFGKPRASVGVKGDCRPDAPGSFVGTVCVPFTGFIVMDPGGSMDGGLRGLEDAAAGEVGRRLARYPELMAEVARLREKLHHHEKSTAGFSTAELMWRDDNGG